MEFRISKEKKPWFNERFNLLNVKQKIEDYLQRNILILPRKVYVIDYLNLF